MILAMRFYQMLLHAYMLALYTRNLHHCLFSQQSWFDLALM